MDLKLSNQGLGAVNMDCIGNELSHMIRDEKKWSRIMSMDSTVEKLNEIIRCEGYLRKLLLWLPRLEDMEDIGLTEEKMIEFQAATTAHLVEGKDIVAAASKRATKPLTFLIPAVELLYPDEFTPQKGTSSILISPTPGMAAWVYLSARDLPKYHSLTPGLIHGYAVTSQEQILKEVHLIVANPPSLRSHLLKTVDFIYDNLKENSTIFIQPHTNLALAAADNNQSGSSTSPGSTNSLLESVGSISVHSDNSLFNVRSPQEETDGIVEEDHNDGWQSESTDESVRRIPIKEIMWDGSKKYVGEMLLEGCNGYYSFASKLRENYIGVYITEVEETDILVHVLWPWHNYRTRYMVNGHELNPTRLGWSRFSKRLQEIWVEIEPLGSTTYIALEHEYYAQSDDMLRIIFRGAPSVSRSDIVRDIDRSSYKNFRSFIWIVHTFWAGWRMKEPLDPEMVTDLNMVLEQSNSLHPAYSVQCFDIDSVLIEIPNHLSLGDHEFSQQSEVGSNNVEEEEAGNGSGDKDGQLTDKDEKDENDELVVYSNVNLERKDSEMDEEGVNDADVEDNDEEDSEILKDFLQRVSIVVIRRS